MAVELEIDVQVLKNEIKKTYASVSQERDKHSASRASPDLGSVAIPAARLRTASPRLTLYRPARGAFHAR